MWFDMTQPINPSQFTQPVKGDLAVPLREGCGRLGEWVCRGCPPIHACTCTHVCPHTHVHAYACIHKWRCHNGNSLGKPISILQLKLSCLHMDPHLNIPTPRLRGSQISKISISLELRFVISGYFCTHID